MARYTIELTDEESRMWEVFLTSWQQRVAAERAADIPPFPLPPLAPASIEDLILLYLMPHRRVIRQWAEEHPEELHATP